MIIVDDCSTDSSAEIINAYAGKDSRIIYLKTEKSSGSPTKPRNIAIEKASGRYIAFLDSDDVWMPTKLEEQLKLLEDEHTAIAFSNYEKMSETGKRKNRMIIAPRVVTYDVLLKGNVIGNVTGMYDTQKVGKVFCPYVHHEDYVVWLSILRQGFVAKNTNKVHALYRLRKRSVSSNKWKV
jgi:glycosyltransferase involved in cell wall biosynthesis